MVNLLKFEELLASTDVIYLSTSLNDNVSSRPVGPMNDGLTIYIRTSSSSRKGKEMIANPNVAACFGNYYMRGRAVNLGSVYDNNNKDLAEKYKQHYKDAFESNDTFISNDECFFKITLTYLAEWIFSDTEAMLEETHFD